MKMSAENTDTQKALKDTKFTENDVKRQESRALQVWKFIWNY